MKPLEGIRACVSMLTVHFLTLRLGGGSDVLDILRRRADEGLTMS